MRIAYITADPGVPVFGKKGCSIHVQEVLRAMGRRGTRIDLFATNCSSGREQAESGELTQATASQLAVTELGAVRLHPLPPAPKGDLALREQKCIDANEQISRALQSEGPFDLVYERYSLWSFAGMEYARSTATPGLLEVNAPLIEEQAEHRGLVDQASARLISERVFRAATALIAVSDEVAEHLEAFPATRGKVRVVPNGVNPDRFPPGIRALLPAEPGTFTVGFVGTMKPWHGLPTLLEAFARFVRRHPESRLLLVGDGAARAKLEEQASALGLAQRAHFTGPVSPGEVPGLLASMDVGVAPYPALRNFYFSPLKVYEYMAAGLPVVASQLGQLQKLIEPEIDGLLVPPGEVLALVAALERLKGDPELRLRLGQAARAKVIPGHTWDGAVRRIFAIAGLDSSPHAENEPRTANIA